LSDDESYGSVRQAFLKSSRSFRSFFLEMPAGWGRGAINNVNAIRHDLEMFVQDLNDKFTSPAGKSSESPKENKN
jgi:hypothetical protein